MERLEAYHWPGNVRELENVIERAVALEPGDVIHADSLPRELRGGHGGRGELEVVLRDSGIDLESHLEDLRRRYMAEAMERAHGVQTRAAEILGMAVRSFRYFAKKYGLTRGELTSPGRARTRRWVISILPRSTRRRARTTVTLVRGGLA
jgi:two-component system response regulator PilR (NtrC family)